MGLGDVCGTSHGKGAEQGGVAWRGWEASRGQAGRESKATSRASSDHC